MERQNMNTGAADSRDITVPVTSEQGVADLLASRGGLQWPKNMLPQGVVFWRQPYAHGKIHSAKPDGFQDLVESLSPGPYLEMFARRQRLGWDTWGDEALNHLEMSA